MLNEVIRRAQRRRPVDVEEVARGLGVRVHYAWLDRDVSGELLRLPSGEYQINVQANDPPTRQRFTIAHELGHYVYHRHLIGAGIDDDRAYRSTNVGRYHNRDIGPKQETEANQFAASLLMPDHLVDEAIGQGLARRQMAAEMGVSEHAMAIRLGESYP